MHFDFETPDFDFFQVLDEFSYGKMRCLGSIFDRDQGIINGKRFIPDDFDLVFGVVTVKNVYDPLWTCPVPLY